jgi:hypothetical protein
MMRKKLNFSALFAPRSPLEFIGFAAISSIISLISAGTLWAFLFVPLFAIAWWLFDRQRTPDIAITLNKEKPQPVKGLILLIGTYSPNKESLKDPNILKPLIHQILETSCPTNTDFAAINLLHSNLQPQIEAIAYHHQRSTLREIWLISSDNENSKQATQILSKYLQTLYGQERLEIHQGPNYAAPAHDYATLLKMVDRIFHAAGYKNEKLIADVTGGTKMMSIAISMACIPKGRRMQYMDAERDWQGNPPQQKGSMSPVLIDFDPFIHKDKP